MVVLYRLDVILILALSKYSIYALLIIRTFPLVTFKIALVFFLNSFKILSTKLVEFLTTTKINILVVSN